MTLLVTLLVPLLIDGFVIDGLVIDGLAREAIALNGVGFDIFNPLVLGVSDDSIVGG